MSPYLIKVIFLSTILTLKTFNRTQLLDPGPRFGGRNLPTPTYIRWFVINVDFFSFLANFLDTYKFTAMHFKFQQEFETSNSRL
jgi:hypothetical protein